MPLLSLTSCLSCGPSVRTKCYFALNLRRGDKRTTAWTRATGFLHNMHLKYVVLDDTGFVGHCECSRGVLPRGLQVLYFEKAVRANDITGKRLSFWQALRWRGLLEGRGQDTRDTGYRLGPSSSVLSSQIDYSIHDASQHFPGWVVDYLCYSSSCEARIYRVLRHSNSFDSLHACRT